MFDILVLNECLSNLLLGNWMFFMSDEDTRTRILTSAGPIFAEKGFAQATVREICQAADVNVASINYHFGDKERLYIETVRCAHRLRVEAVQLPAWTETTTPATKLRGFVRTLLGRMLEQAETPWQSQLMLREVLNPTSACRELVEEHFRPHFEMLAGIIRELAPMALPSYQVHQICFSVVGQCLYYRVAWKIVTILESDAALATHYSIDKLAEHIAQFTLSAVGAGSMFPMAGTPDNNKAID